MPAPTDNPLNALVITAMMQALDEQKRDQLIRKALEALIAPSAPSYGSSRPDPSELETAFNLAVFNTAREVVKEMLDTDEIRAKVRDLAARAFDKMIGADTEALAESMANTFVYAMTKRER